MGLFKKLFGTDSGGSDATGRMLVGILCSRFPMDQVAFMVGNTKIPEVETLVALGDAAIPACRSVLGKTRMVYQVLARINTPQAVAVLTEELKATEWLRNVVSLEALGQVTDPSVLAILPTIEAMRESRVGEVVIAARNARTTIKKRFDKTETSQRADVERLITEVFPKYDKWIPDVNDDELDRCCETARELGRLKDPRAVDALVRILREQPYPTDLPRAATWALKEISQAGTLPALIHLFREMSKPRVGRADAEDQVMAFIAGTIAKIAMKSGDDNVVSTFTDFWESIIADSRYWQIERDIVGELKDISGQKFGSDRQAWLNWIAQRRPMERPSGK